MKRATVEGWPFIHTWSLKHEWLFEVGWEVPRPISVWNSTSYGDHREIYRAAVQLSVNLTPHGKGWVRPDGLIRGQHYQDLTISWSWDERNLQSCMTAVSTPRKVGKNVCLRWWFLCPDCPRRVTALFFKERSLRCRLCHGLIYHSEKLSRSDREINRLDGLPETSQ